MFLLSTLIVSGIVITTLYPFAAAIAAIPIPVFPDVGSISVAPGLISPLSSKSKIIWRAILSLTLPAGLKYSSFAKIVASVAPTLSWYFVTSNNGVFPTNSAALLFIFAIFISSNNLIRLFTHSIFTNHFFFTNHHGTTVCLSHVVIISCLCLIHYSNLLFIYSLSVL